MRRVALRASRFALVVLLAGGRAHAQGWVLDASAGGAVHQAVPGKIDTRSAILGVHYEGDRWLYAAAGAPFDTAGLPWAAAGAGARLSRPRGSLTLGADLAAHAYGYRERVLGALGTGTTLELLPFVGLARGDATVELHAGLLSDLSSFDGESTARHLLDGGADVGLQATPELALAGRGRVLVGSEASYPFLGAAATFSRGPAVAWATAGRWLSGVADDPESGGGAAEWGAGVSYAVSGFLTLHASYDQEASDPLYWNSPTRSWSLGASHALGRRAPEPDALPVPALGVAPGEVTLRVPASASARPPSLAGDFNGWKPVPMTREGEFWSVKLSLAPGVYHYAFQRPDGSWFLPESVRQRVDDGFGGVNAVLVVR